MDHRGHTQQPMAEGVHAALSTIWNYGCECELVPRSWWVGEPKNMRSSYASNPKAFVRRACGENGRAVDIYRLVALTSILVEQPEVRTVALIEKLIRMVLDGYSTGPATNPGASAGRKTCLWERPLIGIANTLLIAKRFGFSGSEDTAIKDKVYEHYKAILRVVRRDLPKILPATEHADHLRYSVIKFIIATGEGYGFDNEQILDDGTMALFLNLWTHMVGPLRTKVHEFVSALHTGAHDACQCSDCNTFSSDERLGRVYGILGAKTVVTTFKTWLSDKISFDGPLASDLRCLELLAYHPAHAHAFCHHDFYYELIGSMGRQYREGKVTEIDIEVFDRGSRLIARLGLCDEHAIDRLLDNLENWGMEKAISGFSAEIHKRIMEDDDYIDEAKMRHTGYWMFIEDLIHSIECQDEGCPKKATEAFEHELRSRFEANFISFSRQLYIFMKDGSAYAKHIGVLWQSLANTLGYTEAGLRQKWLDEAQCWNPKCLSRPHDTKGKNKRCARCHKVWFCSKECQKEEWPHHKKECQAGEPLLRR